MNLRNKKTKELIAIALDYTTMTELAKMMTTIGLEELRTRRRDHVKIEFNFSQQLDIVKIIKKLMKENR
tara:strand:- start:13327 stop:13533 length:207 start_codon:yes stop_codon:yes gene_type:complete